MARKVFLVDSNPQSLQSLKKLLERHHYLVETADRAPQALEKIRIRLPDLILLDAQLPDIDGFQVCRELKTNVKTYHLPIIMYSAVVDETEVVVALELGAEDYVFKPFRKKELLARIKAILRRNSPFALAPKLEAGPISIDFTTYTVHVKNKRLILPPKEIELLALFIKREGQILTRSVISETVWGFEFTGSSRTIDVHVDFLRKRLGRYGSFIKALKGVGYKFQSKP